MRFEARIKRHRVGEVSSKYGYQPELFDRDMDEHEKRCEAEWQAFKAWMIEHQIDPEKLRYMFARLYDEYLT